MTALALERIEATLAELTRRRQAAALALHGTAMLSSGIQLTGNEMSEKAGQRSSKTVALWPTPEENAADRLPKQGGGACSLRVLQRQHWAARDDLREGR
jgi:hypothetical protein